MSAVIKFVNYGIDSWQPLIPLEDVVVNPTRLVGLELFEKIKGDLARAVESRNKRVLCRAVPPIVSLGVSIGGAIYGSIAGDINGFFVFLVGLSVSGTSSVYAILNNGQENALLYSQGQEAIQQFYESCKAFEENPQGVAIQPIVNRYENIFKGEWFRHNLTKGLISKEEELFFKQQGKFILMNRLIKMIEPHEPKSDFVSNWSIELAALSNPEASYPATDLWSSLEMTAPYRIVCTADSLKQVTAMVLSMKIMGVFCRVVPKVI